MKVAILTQAQADELNGTPINGEDVSLFAPAKDGLDRWVIGEEEINQTNISWVKELKLVEYVKPQSLVL